MAKVSEELLYPSFIDLVKITQFLLEKGSQKGLHFTQDEFKEAIRVVAIKCSQRAWKDEKSPLYVFSSRWDSPELSREIEHLFEGPFLHFSDLTLTENAVFFLKSYEAMGLFTEYRIKTLEEIIDEYFQSRK
jgi:hypothetical protein